MIIVTTAVTAQRNTAYSGGFPKVYLLVRMDWIAVGPIVIA